MARSLNKAVLIGNLTRDPELRYTPQGSAVCTFGLATNRQWTTESGEKKEDVEFHRIVAWNKLAELCAQLLTKGRKVYLEGRIQTRNWDAQDGTKRTTTEIVISEMIILDSRRGGEGEFDFPEEGTPEEEGKEKPKKKSASKKKKKTKSSSKKESEDEDEIPF
jgi:single-strand DNA-binding protein